MEPWSPRDATENIRSMAVDSEFGLHWTAHAKERMEERGLIMSDILYLLRKGFVYEKPEKATQKGLYRYEMEAITPNSNNRIIKAVLIPNPKKPEIKICTVMWKEER